MPTGGRESREGVIAFLCITATKDNLLVATSALVQIVSSLTEAVITSDIVMKINFREISVQTLPDKILDHIYSKYYQVNEYKAQLFL